MAMTWLLLQLAPLALAGAMACAAGPWDVARLQERHPVLGAIGEHRLGDTTPYLLPANGSIAFFLCHWPAGEPVPVSLPPDASAAERTGLEQVMRAWEGAGLGVRFVAGAAPGVGIEIRFIDPEAGATETVHAANTIADCAVSPEALPDAAASVLPARLVFASIYLWRGGFDNLGRPDPHSHDEFIGSALHEFGHALGFQGHAHLGRSVMVKETDAARWAARRVLQGDSFSDHTLRALYAVPSGTVVKRAIVDAIRTGPVDRMLEMARRRGFTGPFVRVGDLDAQLAWRDPAAGEYALRIFDVRKVLRAPDTLWIRPTLATSLLFDAGVVTED